MSAVKSKKQPAKKPAAIDLGAELARINEQKRTPQPLARAGGQGGSSPVLQGSPCPCDCLRDPGRAARGSVPRTEEAPRQPRCGAAATGQAGVSDRPGTCRSPSRSLRG